MTSLLDSFCALVKFADSLYPAAFSIYIITTPSDNSSSPDAYTFPPKAAQRRVF